MRGQKSARKSFTYYLKSIIKVIASLTTKVQLTPSKAELRQSFSAWVYRMQLRFQVFTLIGSKQGNYLENATACSKRTLKTTVATQLKTQCLTENVGVNASGNLVFKYEE